MKRPTRSWQGLKQKVTKSKKNLRKKKRKKGLLLLRLTVNIIKMKNQRLKRIHNQEKKSIVRRKKRKRRMIQKEREDRGLSRRSTHRCPLAERRSLKLTTQWAG